MVDVRLGIPLTIPILGEAFVSLNNPAVFATLDFYYQVRVKSEKADHLELTLKSPTLTRVLMTLLKKEGLSAKFSITSQVLDQCEFDFLATAAMLYITGPDRIEPEVPAIMSKLQDRDFITFARALTSLSGGFVVCRKGEGLVSLEGKMDAFTHVRLNGKVRGIKEALMRFTEAFPELAAPFWHLMGHLVLEGGSAIREGDAEKMGKLMTFESDLLYSLGLADLNDLQKLSQLNPNYGGKIICSGAMNGVVVLTPKETSSQPYYNRFKFSADGVKEVG
jgi:mevalonate kinase